MEVDLRRLLGRIATRADRYGRGVGTTRFTTETQSTQRALRVLCVSVRESSFGSIVPIHLVVMKSVIALLAILIATSVFAQSTADAIIAKELTSSRSYET